MVHFRYYSRSFFFLTIGSVFISCISGEKRFQRTRQPISFGTYTVRIPHAYYASEEEKIVLVYSKLTSQMR